MSNGIFWSVIIIISVANFKVVAQDDVLAPKVIDSKPLEIGGSIDQEEQEEPSSEEILDEARRKSEIKNVKIISKKIEKIKIPEHQVKRITDKESRKIFEKINGIVEGDEDSSK